MIYSCKALEKVVKELKLIPRTIKSTEKLKVYHKYWIEEYGVVKVTDVFDNGGTEYYQIRYNDMVACISYPVSSRSIIYELLHNDNNLEDTNIINNTIKFSGAEIKYWLCVNDIEKYPYFKEHLEDLVDSRFYLIEYNPKTEILQLK